MSDTRDRIRDQIIRETPDNAIPPSGQAMERAIDARMEGDVIERMAKARREQEDICEEDYCECDGRCSDKAAARVLLEDMLTWRAADIQNDKLSAFDQSRARDYCWGMVVYARSLGIDLSEPAAHDPDQQPDTDSAEDAPGQR